MLVVTIEMHSARTKETTVLGRAIINNVGTSADGKKGDYAVRVGHKDRTSLQAVLRSPLRRGEVKGHNRLSENVWRLVLKAIAAAFPEQRIRLPDPDAIESPIPDNVRKPTSVLLPADGDPAKRRRRIYLAGPMKGYPAHNYPAFDITAGGLRALGHEVYNPADFNRDGAVDGTFDLRAAFAAYSRFICEVADTLVLLPGWETSTGVRAELALAINCGLDIIEWGE